jgi:hypothetical protein
VAGVFDATSRQDIQVRDRRTVRLRPTLAGRADLFCDASLAL